MTEEEQGKAAIYWMRNQAGIFDKSINMQSSAQDCSRVLSFRLEKNIEGDYAKNKELRQFAAMAMQGLLSNENEVYRSKNTIAELAIKQVQELQKQLDEL
jgi:hypothetical protein